MRQRLHTYFKNFELKTEIAACWAEAHYEIVTIIVAILCTIGVIAAC